MKQKDIRDKQADWNLWVPELEQQFRDRLLSLVAERFKIESIAQSASERGAKNLEDVLRMLSDIGPEAAKRFPRMVWIDQIYKYLGDTRRG